MLKLINTRLRRPGRPCRGPSNGGVRPPNASVSKIVPLRDARALRRGALSTARTRRPCDAHKPLRRKWSPRTQNREMRLFRQSFEAPARFFDRDLNKPKSLKFGLWT